MHDKVTLYCNLNDIADAHAYFPIVDIFSSYQHCISYNTHAYLVQGLRDLHRGTIDDEQFFMIGDITSDRVVKTSYPHLDAVDTILSAIQPQTLYVIDNAAKIAYTHIHGSRDIVEKKLTEHASTIVSV